VDRGGAGRLRRPSTQLIAFAIPAIVAAAYHLFALYASVRRWLDRRRSSAYAPPVSILKPVRGREEHFFEAIRSHVQQDYPEFEILFGLSDPQDPARADIERLRREFPKAAIRIIETATSAPNQKVGTLEILSSVARYPILLVNDSDIAVDPNYLRQVVSSLEEPSVGLVTCLYRATGSSFAARSEALGIATEFAPSVLVAREVGVNEVAMGSTLAFRAADLKRMGGFAAIRDYIADDYQLGKGLSGLGLRVVLGAPVVCTHLGSGSWRDVWKHQLRWSRTIRVSRPGGYYGYGITHAAFWCLLAALAGEWRIALACYAARVVSALFIAAAVMRDSPSLQLFGWLPVRDFIGFAVWLVGAAGGDVEWRGQKLELEPDGRIAAARAAAHGAGQV
jgi:ceramide glucosyltransferase